MRLVFIGGALDHITLPLCQAFFSILGNEFTFVATKPVSSSRTDLGYGGFNEKYCYVIKGYENPNRAKEIINNAEIVIYGAAPESFVARRMREGKLTFRFTERLYKEPFTWKNFLYRKVSAFLHHGIYQRKKVYILCAGAYVAYDFSRFKYYLNKCYKWCYFTEVSTKRYEELETLKDKNDVTEIIWTARFIDLKHPELVVKLAKYLNSRKVAFHITMIGGGECLETIKDLAKQLKVQNSISFLGAVEPNVVKLYMEKADISLFTSGRQEGWGAVVNEAMGSGCAVVASSAAGAPPFLINDGKTGVLFDINDLESYYSSVYDLIIDKKKRRCLGKNAYQAVQSLWTPQNAAEYFLALARSIEDGNPIASEEGPCSVAPILKDGWYKKSRRNNEG